MISLDKQSLFIFIWYFGNNLFSKFNLPSKKDNLKLEKSKMSQKMTNQS